MTSVYLYAVSYDLGFAPNPFGGLCSLACCKPRIRSCAERGDWIVGMGGTKLKATGRCVFAMQVSGSTTFDSYWSDPRFKTRKPQRTGSAKKWVGDNIYHRSSPGGPWLQADSVHSQEDGVACPENTAHDTRVDRILLSERYVYFGSSAPVVPAFALDAISYAKNPRDYRKFSVDEASALVGWIETQVKKHRNEIVADPFDFGSVSKRYSAKLKKLV